MCYTMKRKNYSCLMGQPHQTLWMKKSGRVRFGFSANVWGAECETDGNGRSVAQRRGDKTIGFTRRIFVG